MSDDTQQTDAELFDSTKSDSSAEEPTTKTTQEEELLGEEAKDKNVPTVGELNRQKQVEVWTERVLKGEADIDNLPSNLKWLKQPIQARLDSLNKEPDIEEIVEKKLAEKEEENIFKSMLASVQESKISDAKRKELQDEYSDLRKSGLTKAKALEKALKITKIDLGTTSRAELREAMAIPKGAGSRQTTEVTMENFKNLSEKERLEYYKSLEKGR